MKVYPAIDLQNGQCVRLKQGHFDSAKIYEIDPLLQAKKFAVAGAKCLHVVDLDGARSGSMTQFDTIARLAEKTQLKIQAGGGIRDGHTVEKLLDAGVERVVVGSLAVKDRSLVRTWLKKFGPDAIVVAFDVRFADNIPEILTQGWQSDSKLVLWDILDEYKQSGLRHILCTDVERDGMLTGANVPLYQEIHKRNPELKVLASGGVTGMEDLHNLTEAAVEGVIIGKALYEGWIDLADAIEKVGDAC